MLVKIKEHLVLYGGIGITKNIDTTCIQLLNLETYTWYKIEGGVTDISSRSNFSFEQVDDTAIIIFGGIENFTGNFLDEVLILDLEKLEIKKKEIAGDYPEPRAGHMICKTTNKDYSKLMVVGGLNSVIVSMDIYFLSFEKSKKDGMNIIKQRKTDEDKEVERIANDYLFEMNKKNNALRDLILFETQKQLKFKRQYEEVENTYKSALETCNMQITRKQEELNDLKKLKNSQLDNIEKLLNQIKTEEVKCDLNMEKIILLQQSFRDIFRYTSTLDKVLTLAVTAKPVDKNIKDATVIELIKENKIGLKTSKEKLLDCLGQTKQFYLEFETTQTTLEKSIDAYKTKIIKNFPVFEKMYRDNELNLSVIESSENED